MEGKIDVLIVGQGLAGSLLAWQLIQHGKRVRVLDDNGPAASSPVAAGMVNPLAGRRLALYPDTDRYLAAARACYTHLSEELGQAFYHPTPIFRYFQNEQEAERFTVRQQDPAFAPYLGEILIENGHPIGFVTRGGGWLDVPGLLTALRAWLAERGLWQSQNLDDSALQATPDGVQWNELEAAKVVFCEGWRGSRNPWFRGLPWDPVKGEILRLKVPGLPHGRILNRGKWLVPAPGEGFRGGATYERAELDNQATTQGRAEVLDGLQKLIPGQSLEVTGHDAGVRPGTCTQHPFLGKHPEQEAIFIFNGFGSRGTLLIPYLTEIFCRHLYKGCTLPQTMDIRAIWKS